MERTRAKNGNGEASNVSDYPALKLPRPKKKSGSPHEVPARQIQTLRVRVQELEQTLDAIRSGEVDALVVPGEHGEQIFALEGANHPYRVLIEAMNEGAVTLHANGLILHVNRRFAEMIQMPDEKLIGSVFPDLIPAAQRAPFSALLRQAAAGRSAKAEFALHTSGGGMVPVLLSMATAAINAQDGIVLVVTDLSERKSAEEALRRANADLLLRVDERTRELAGANQHMRTELDARRRAEEDLRASESRLRQANAQLDQRIAELQRASDEIKESRRAALNLMEDAIKSRETLGRLNAELRASEERQRFLLRFNDALRTLADPLDIQETAAGCLGEHLHLSRVLYGETDGDYVLFHRCFTNGLSPIVGRLRALDYGARMVSDFRAGRCNQSANVQTEETITEAERVKLHALGIGAYLCVPLIKDGGWVATFSIHSATPRHWTAEELSLVQETAERTWASVERAKAQAALRESKQALKAAHDYAEATLRTSPVPLVVLDKDLRVNTANEAFYKVFQVPSAETEGRLVYELGNGQWRIPQLRKLLEEVLPLHTLFTNFEVTHHFEYIGQRTMILNARRMENQAGAPERIVLVIEDITERKQAEEALRRSEERFRMMADNIAQLAWTCDQLGNVTWYNKRWLDYTGLTFEDMRDWGWKKVHHPDHVDRVVASVQRSRESGEIWEDTFPLRGKDGNYRWFLSRAVPIRNAEGNTLRWFGTNTDITEQRTAEDRLRDAHQLLTDEAAHLEALVQERTARLQETIGDLEHFSYTITHDMRAPLRAMQGFGAMLVEDSASHLSTEGADYLIRIMNAASRMDALICDSLQYAKVVRERTPLTSVHPAQILHGILDSYPALQPPRVAIQLVEPFPPVQANEAGLTQCFSNLLVNAVKFVKPGVQPKIRIWAETVPAPSAFLEGKPSERRPTNPPIQKSNPGWVRFWFEDNGIGIPAQYLDRIFGMFQQLDKSYEGTGIGLALVRKTAERMNGKVGVESEPGKGSRFWLEFQAT